MGDPFDQRVTDRSLGGIHVGRQYDPVICCIGERVVRCVHVHQKIEGRLVELLDDDFALDHQFGAGRAVFDDRRIGMALAAPAALFVALAFILPVAVLLSGGFQGSV